jgi:hypothetical protein
MQTGRTLQEASEVRARSDTPRDTRPQPFPGCSRRSMPDRPRTLLVRPRGTCGHDFAATAYTLGRLRLVAVPSPCSDACRVDTGSKPWSAGFQVLSGMFAGPNCNELQHPQSWCAYLRCRPQGESQCAWTPGGLARCLYSKTDGAE